MVFRYESVFLIVKNNVAIVPLHIECVCCFRWVCVHILLPLWRRIQPLRGGDSEEAAGWWWGGNKGGTAQRSGCMLWHLFPQCVRHMVITDKDSGFEMSVIMLNWNCKHPSMGDGTTSSQCTVGLRFSSVAQIDSWDGQLHHKLVYVSLKQGSKTAHWPTADCVCVYGSYCMLKISAWRWMLLRHPSLCTSEHHLTH